LTIIIKEGEHKTEEAKVKVANPERLCEL